MKTKKIIIDFYYFDKLRLSRMVGTSTQAGKDNLEKLEVYLKNNIEELEKLYEKRFSIYNVKIRDYKIVKYKWWEFWK